MGFPSVSGPPRHVARAIPASVVAVALGGAVLVGAAVTVTSRAKPEPTEPAGPTEPMTDVEELNARSEELRGWAQHGFRDLIKKIWRVVLMFFLKHICCLLMSLITC